MVYFNHTLSSIGALLLLLGNFLPDFTIASVRSAWAPMRTSQKCSSHDKINKLSSPLHSAILSNRGGAVYDSDDEYDEDDECDPLFIETELKKVISISPGLPQDSEEQLTDEVLGEMESQLCAAIDRQDFVEAQKIQKEISQMHIDDRGSILQVNSNFYKALSNQDYDAMERIWLKDALVTCIHPSVAPLVGAKAVLQSWKHMFESTDGSYFGIKPLGMSLVVKGSTAILTCDEEVFGKRFVRDSHRQTEIIAKLTATNVFRKIGGTWYMVHHHASWHADSDRAEAAFNLDTDESSRIVLRGKGGDGGSTSSNSISAAIDRQDFVEAQNIQKEISQMHIDDCGSILQVNSKFYKAFSNKDSDTMERIWLKDVSITCIHPSLETLVGANVLFVWKRALDVMDELAEKNCMEPSGMRLVVKGTTAILTCDMEVIDRQSVRGSRRQIEIVEKRIITTNIFQKVCGTWYMVHHHASWHADSDRAKIAFNLNTDAYSEAISRILEWANTSDNAEVVESNSSSPTSSSSSSNGNNITKGALRQNCISTLRKLCEQGSISPEQKRVLLTDIITCSAKGELSTVEVAYELLFGEGEDMDIAEEEFTEQCRVFVASLSE